MTDNKQWMPIDAKCPHCLWQGELKRILKCEYLHEMFKREITLVIKLLKER
jgi:hypothetical protein